MIAHPIRIPYSDSPIARSSIQDTFTVQPPTTPSDDVDASSMPTEGVFTMPCSS